MFSTIKAKLIALIAVAMVAIVSISATGFIGMRNGSDAVRQYSEHRMPSLYGLMEIARGQLRVRVNNRDLVLLENDPGAQAKVSKLLEERLSALGQIEKGGKIYESLPLGSEEAEVWKQFKSNWSEFLKLCNDVNPEMERLAKAKSPKELVEIFGEIKKLIAKVRVSASALQLTLDKLMEMNDRQAASYAQSSAALMSTMTVTTNSASGIAILLILLIGLYVFRSTMKQLGGEPGVAAEVANRIALGDFTSKIELKAGDSGSLMASMQQMSEKLSETITQVRTTAEELTNASTQVSSTSQVLSQATSEQAASLEETTSAIEQMSASIAQNTDNAKTTDGIARKSSEDALANAASSEELSATAEEMSAQAVNLMEIMAQFKVVGDTTMRMATRPASTSRTTSAKRPVKASEGVNDFEKF
ncbi:MAG: methyl-accepting chemotaxis protein [Proteobacteria bacterium]|nr:methyl-accepting chemotaxis protein [Pseudomonadota bacterium]